MTEQATASSAGSAANAEAALLVQGGPKDGGGPSSDELRHRLSEGSPLCGLPMQLDVTIPIPSFRVQNLLALEKGAVVESNWAHSEDVPVWCGGAQLVWAEFEVVERKLAVRVTRLG